MTPDEIKADVATIVNRVGGGDAHKDEDKALARLLTNFLVNQQIIADALTHKPLFGKPSKG